MSTTTGRTGTQGRVTLPGVSREIENVLLWRDARLSGGAFTVGSLVYFVLEWSGYSLLTIVSTILMTGVALGFAWNTVARFTNRTQSSPAFTRPVNESDVKQLAQQLTILFNKSLAVINRTISGTDPVLTAEVFGALYLVAKVGRIFSALGLVYTLFVLAFVLPKLYELRKDDIDGAVSTGYHHTNKLYQQNLKPYIDQIPRASSSGRSSGTTSTSTRPTAAGRNAGVNDTATSGPSATLQDKLGAGNAPTGGNSSGYGGGSGTGLNTVPGTGQGTGQRSHDSTGSATSINPIESYGQGSQGGQGGQGYSSQGTTGSGYPSQGGQGSYTDAARDTVNQLGNRAGETYNQATGQGQGGQGYSSQGNTGSGNYQGSYTDAARDTMNQLGNRAGEAYNQATGQGQGSRTNY